MLKPGKKCKLLSATLQAACRELHFETPRLSATTTLFKFAALGNCVRFLVLVRTCAGEKKYSEPVCLKRKLPLTHAKVFVRLASSLHASQQHSI